MKSVIKTTTRQTSTKSPARTPQKAGKTARVAQSSRAAKKSAQKPSARPSRPAVTAKKPVRKPAQKPSAKPSRPAVTAKKPVRKPAQKPSARPSRPAVTAKKPVRKPAQKPSTRPSRSAVAAKKPVRKPAPKPSARPSRPAVTAKKPAPKPSMRLSRNLGVKPSQSAKNVIQKNQGGKARSLKKATHSFIALSKPIISKNDLVSVLRCMLSDKLTELDGGTMIAQFENAFAHVVGKHHALFAVNDSAALYLILKQIKIKRGDEVIVSPLIEPQIWETLRHVGANIVFADCAKESFSFDAETLRKTISEQTRAVIFSHAFGFPHAEAETLIKSIKHDFPKVTIIEEALHSLGTTYFNQKKSAHVGTLGDYGLFSLASQRTLTSAKGAVIITKHRERLDELRVLRTPDWGQMLAQSTPHLGLGRTVRHLPSLPGSKDRDRKKSTHTASQSNDHETFNRLDLAPTELEAALGLSQLQSLKSFAVRRQELTEKLEEVLPKRSDVKILTHGSGSSNHRFLALYFPTGKATAYERLARSGLPNVLLHPHTLYGYLEYHNLQEHYQTSPLKATQDLHRRVLLIPIHVSIKDEELTTLRTVLKSL